MMASPQPPDGDAAVHTIGHSTRPLADFLGLLRARHIELVCDVRTAPGSRRFPHFSSRQLAESLAGVGIGYEHMPELGGLRRPRPDSANTGWRNSSFRGFADHMGTEEFERGLARLVEVAAGCRRAIMCAEAVPWRCHRSLIADALIARGVSVLHIIGSAEPRPHSLTSFARIHRGHVAYPAGEPGCCLGSGEAVQAVAEQPVESAPP